MTPSPHAVASLAAILEDGPPAAVESGLTYVLDAIFVHLTLCEGWPEAVAAGFCARFGSEVMQQIGATPATRH